MCGQLPVLTWKSLEVFMLIRIICLDKLFHKSQQFDFDKYIAEKIAAATAGYIDR